MNKYDAEIFNKEINAAIDNNIDVGGGFTIKKVSPTMGGYNINLSDGNLDLDFYKTKPVIRGGKVRYSIEENGIEKKSWVDSGGTDIHSSISKYFAKMYSINYGLFPNSIK